LIGSERASKLRPIAAELPDIRVFAALHRIRRRMERTEGRIRLGSASAIMSYDTN
jgi:hypothetical protein